MLGHNFPSSGHSNGHWFGGKLEESGVPSEFCLYYVLICSRIIEGQHALIVESEELHDVAHALVACLDNHILLVVDWAR